nr:hypothetical protein [Paraburkholderia hospita]
MTAQQLGTRVCMHIDLGEAMEGTFEKAPVAGSNIRKQSVCRQCLQPDASRKRIEQCVHQYAGLPEEVTRSSPGNTPG